MFYIRCFDVINKSRDSAAPRRAEAILRHMERRHASNSTEIAPNADTYTTVIHCE